MSLDKSVTYVYGLYRRRSNKSLELTPVRP